jgi:hypothetical protein
MSIISFEMAEYEVMEGGWDRDADTINNETPPAGNTSSNSDAMEAATTTNN